MKKSLSFVLVAILLICCFSVPCMAVGDKTIRLDVEYSTETKLLTFSGSIFAEKLSTTSTFYLLKPGKIKQDLKNHSKDNPVIENYGEFQIEKSGEFSHTLKIAGDPGIYTLYFQAGGVHVTRQIDTSKDVSADGGLLSELHALKTEYPAVSGTTVKELYEEKREEYPEEMPIVKKASTKGLKSVYIDVEEGSDSTGKGTFEKPFKTVNKAMKAVAPQSGIAYVLREGTYPISDRITISNVKADNKNPLIITNYEDEVVTFVGGTNIDSSSFKGVTDAEIIQRLDPSVVDKIMVADLKNDYGITTFEKITTDSQPVLFVGESEYQLARWPNYETTPMKKYEGEDGENGVVDSGWYNIAVGSTCGDGYRKYSKRVTEKIANGEDWVASDNGIQFCVEDLKPFSWVNTGDIWMYGRFYDEWTLNHFNISEFHPENGSLRMASGLNWGCKYDTDNKFYYYNILEELDIPGEWFLDKDTGKLYVYPTADFNDVEIVYAQSASDIITIERSENIVINGINFEDSRGRAIYSKNEVNNNILIQNCNFENLNSGAYLVGTYSGVIHSKFKNLKGNGITINGTSANRVNLVPEYNFAQNNVLYNTRGIDANGVGGILSHNFISNNVGSCIYIAGNEMVIEYNEIVAGPMVVLDAGAIYVNGNGLSNRGTHVRYNYIHDAPINTMTIYFDDMSVESYAYGNIMENCGKMLFHNGIEMIAENNIFIDIPAKNAAGKANVPFTNSQGYYSQAKNGKERWRVGSLEMGSFTKRLDETTTNYVDPYDGIYAKRYPLFSAWAELMYKRIDEYNKLVAGGTNKVTAAKTSSISTTYKKPNGTYYNINEYLAACRDCVYENNVFINTADATVGQTNAEGFINTIWQNNIKLASSENPFTNRNYVDESAYDAIRAKVPGFDSIPFENIGLMDESAYTINAQTKAVSPVSTTDTGISKQDLTLQWESVDGAQQYYVELAKDKNFANILEVATTFELSYKVISDLEENGVYYWRVTTIPKAICSTGSQLTSDTFCFKILPEHETVERNQVGVTSYSVDDMKKDSFKVTTYVYNLKDAAADAKVYVACYDVEDRLVSVDSEIVSIPAKTIEGEHVFNITAPGTKTIKFFVWSADGKMIPYTFVKTIK